MLCPKCSAPVQTDQKRCSQCSAMLPWQAPEGNSEHLLALREGVTYLSPSRAYQTPAIRRLGELVGQLLEGEDRFDELEDHLDELGDRFAEFEQRYAADMQALLVREASRFPEDDLNLQLSDLLRRGLQIFEDGRRLFEAFFDHESEDPDELDLAFQRICEGHDYLCLTFELAEARLRELRALLRAEARREVATETTQE